MRGRFVLILGQGRSGSTLILRMLNAAPGVLISGENGHALSHLRSFVSSFDNTRSDRDGSQHSLAWAAPPGLAQISTAIQGMLTQLYNPAGNYPVFGFKEIRYGTGDYVTMERDIDFLRSIFPNLRVVFNVRDTESCVKSSWWASNPTAARKVLDNIRSNFTRYFESHPDFCFWLPYESLRAGSAEVRDLFSFVGAPYGPASEAELAKVIR